MKLELTKPQYLAAASLVAGKSEFAPHYYGVCVEPNPQGGVFLVASDGHRMVVFRDCEGRADGVCRIKVDRALFNAAKFRKTGPAERVLTAEGDVLRVSYASDDVDDTQAAPLFLQPFAPLDGGSLAQGWRRCAVTRTDLAQRDTDSPSFNARYLGDFAKVIDAAWGNAEYRPIRLAINGLDPALVTNSERDWFGLVLPCRGGAPDRIPFDIELGEAV